MRQRKIAGVPKLWSILFASLFVLANLSAASANIAGSAHDFSADGWSHNQICLPCHTPHGGNKNVIDDAPLWNHTITTATYTPYNSRTLNAISGQPDGVTKLCLSCHDGTVALDAYRGGLGTTYMGTVRLDRRSSHPVSILYDSALASVDTGLHDPAVATTELGGTIAQNLLTYNSKLQCTSCHNVHNKYGHEKLLVIDNAGSKLCLTCHNK